MAAASSRSGAYQQSRMSDPSTFDMRPVPDPTQLTTEQLRRELGMLRELIEAKLESVSATIIGMDKTNALLQDAVRLLATEEEHKRNNLKELFGEKFSGIQKQFDERDVRATASETAAKEAQSALSVASTTAVNAALQAQKESAFATQQSNAEAIRKSEAGFTNEINALKALIESTKETLASTVGDLRSRLDRGEGNERGVKEQRVDAHGSQSTFIAIAALAVSIIVGGFAVFHNTNTGQPITAFVSPVPNANR